MGVQCSACGLSGRPAARFCRGCGQPLPAVPATGGTAAWLQPPPSSPGGAAPTMAPPGFQPAAAAPWSASPAFGPEVSLPPPPEPWAFQVSLGAQAARLCGTLENSGLSAASLPGRLAQRMARATMCEPTVFREVAQDRGAMVECLAAAGIAVAVGAIGPTALVGILGGFKIASLLQPLAMALASTAGLVAAAAVLAPAVAGRSVAFSQLFRALLLAQSPSVLGIVPGLGQLLQLWGLMTNTAALRSVLGCETGKAVVLLIAGIIGAGVAAGLAVPVLGLLLR